MASTFSDEALASLRRKAKAAEPYPADHPYMDTFDGIFTPEEQARIDARFAQNFLIEFGYSLEDDPHD